MLIDYKDKRWEFNTIEEAVFVAKDLVKTLKLSYGIDVFEDDEKVDFVDDDQFVEDDEIE